MEIDVAFEGVRQAVLMALDDAYSDRLGMDEAYQKIVAFVNKTVERDMTPVLDVMYTEWKEDRGIA